MNKEEELKKLNDRLNKFAAELHKDYPDHGILIQVAANDGSGDGMFVLAACNRRELLPLFLKNCYNATKEAGLLVELPEAGHDTKH